MSSLDNKKLIRLIRYAPVAVVCLFSIAVIAIAIQDNREKALHSSNSLREELLNQRREVVRSQVHQVYKQLIVEKSQIRSQLEAYSKQRTYEAYGIAHHIYANNYNRPQEEVLTLIAEALRPIRFSNGRGYYFMLDKNANINLHSAQPELEGQNLWNSVDSNGEFYARKLVEVAQTRGEGFLQWRFPKPGASLEQDWRKVGFVKDFEPYHWTIGTGEYLSDGVNDVKNRLIEWFSDYEYGEGGYFFVINKTTGAILSLHHNDFMGLDFQVGKHIDDELHSKILEQLTHGGGFITFQKPLTLSGDVQLEQVSYVREIKGWDWVIGTGFSTGSFEKYLRLKEEQLDEFNNKSLSKLIVLTLISTLFLTIVSLYVSNLIARRFEMFQSRITKDFNELNKTKNRMEYMALHDELTGLPNRVSLIKEINKGVSYARDMKCRLAVMFVDLDNFKNVNDLYGHGVGDQLLEVVSRKFESLIGNRDLVSRFGGDEFIFCFPRLKDAEEARQIATNIHAILAEAIIIDGRVLTTSCSIGVSMFPEDSNDAETLISKADTVLYRAKATNRGSTLFYDDSVREQIKYRMTIEDELVRVIGRGEMYICYQPQIDVNENKVYAVEALARWKNEKLGFVPPDSFISVAEETGFIHTLGLYLFKKACKGLVDEFPNGMNAPMLSFNVSPLQIFDPSFCDNTVRICREIGISPKRITLEITENIPINDLKNVLPFLEELRGAGFGLSLDDFGTGYSSLSYINTLPLTEIKIDRSFINQFLRNDQTQMLVKMILGIGQSCGTRVVSEGVETAEELEKLKELGCDLVQGYYFDAPITIEELAKKCTENLGYGLPCDDDCYSIKDN
ncbi:bifunctional diguanylate cyclase/phosphodiesterase [Marinomonas balearica]|uniref:Diguanylate cyclase/phosphodiesterase n=1 Tax=Marinomonas balearica TaxID=491947 RepID=A0A4R6ME72_9GAMM|nr:cache domain-containing protein [Marinomonas balearica]TDO99923.1 diguanylate cyclase/phosphodiesterase [Marinomonas balearica]